MIKPIFTFLLMLLSMLSFGQQVQQRLSLSPAVPIAGKPITLTYNAKGSDLEFSDEVSAQCLLFQNLKWEKQPVKLNKVNGMWTAKANLPAGISFFTVRFYQGDAEKPEAADNNDGKGFYSPVLNAKKKPSAGYYLGEVLLSISGEELIPFAKPSMDGAKVDALMKKEAQFSNVMLSEDLLSRVQRYYQFNLKDVRRADQLAAEIKSRFPKGETARTIAYHQAVGEKDPAKLIESYESFLQNYPIAEWRKGPQNQSYIYYTIYRGLAAAYYESKQYDKFLALFPDFDFKTANEVYRWNLTRADVLGTEEEKIAILPVSRKIIPYLLKLQNDGSYKEDFGGNKALEDENVRKQLSERLFTHISLLKTAGAYAEGLKMFDEMPDQKLYASADLNEIHLLFFEKTGNEKAIKPLLEASVKTNALTPVMLDKLKSIYLSAHNGLSDGYEQYLSSLKSSENLVIMREHVMANMVRHPLIPFSLENPQGKMVNSADWKDKIVVIDFWATWCRPCIMAFPGMQLLVDKYAKDPSVAIYMIGTMQFGDYKAKSEGYVKSKGFRFNLLHDALGDNGEQDKVFKSLTPLFKSSGIPRKIIVKNGEVRYSSEGYSGSPSQLMDELSMAIEILRVEK